MQIIHRNYLYESIDLDNPIKGGLGDKSKVDPSELEKGISVEKEHVGDLNDPEKLAVARDIAKDHLAEHPKYYEALKKMEDGLEKDESRA